MPTLQEVLIAGGVSASLAAALMRYGIRYLFLPSQIIGKPALLDPLRQRFKRVYPTGFIESKIPSGGVMIDAAEWHDPAGANKAVNEQRWIVWSNANGVCFEELLRDRFIPEYARRTRANILLWNYRGVGHSTGSSSSAHHLVTDGVAVLNVLLDRGILPQNILLHGHSMGGGTACVVAAKSKLPVAVLSDRSFSSLKAVVKSHTARGPLGALIGALLLSAGSTVATLLLEFGLGSPTVTGPMALSVAVLGLSAQAGWVASILRYQIHQIPSWLQPLLVPISVLLVAVITTAGLGAAQSSRLGRAVLCGSLGVCAAAAAAFCGVLPWVLSIVASLLGWELDAYSAWQQLNGRKGIIFHKQDGMINYETASLQRAVIGQGHQIVEMTVRHPNCHMIGLSDGNPVEWDAVIELANSLLDTSASKM